MGVIVSSTKRATRRPEDEKAVSVLMGKVASRVGGRFKKPKVEKRFGILHWRFVGDDFTGPLIILPTEHVYSHERVSRSRLHSANAGAWRRTCACGRIKRC